VGAYLRDIIEPHVLKLRIEQTDPTLSVYLVLDNRDFHNRPCVLEQITAANIIAI
jgi:hypothetical protein